MRSSFCPGFDRDPLSLILIQIIIVFGKNTNFERQRNTRQTVDGESAVSFPVMLGFNVGRFAGN